MTWELGQDFPFRVGCWVNLYKKRFTCKSLSSSVLFVCRSVLRVAVVAHQDGGGASLIILWCTILRVFHSLRHCRARRRAVPSPSRMRAPAKPPEDIIRKGPSPKGSKYK